MGNRAMGNGEMCPRSIFSFKRCRCSQNAVKARTIENQGGQGSVHPGGVVYTMTYTLYQKSESHFGVEGVQDVAYVAYINEGYLLVPSSRTQGMSLSLTHLRGRCWTATASILE